MLTIVYAIFSYIVNSIYQHAVGLMMPLHTPSQVMLLTIGYILASPFSIISQFSGLHLLAQFGMKIGLGPEKPKPTDPDTDHNEEQNVSDLDTD